MTKVQTSVSYSPVRGREGDVANSKPKFAVSMVAEEKIKAGRFVKLGSDSDKQVLNLDATGDVALGKLVGVSLHDLSRGMSPLLEDNTGGEGVRDFDVKEGLAVMKEGSVYMLPETAVNPSTSVYIRHAGRAQVQTLVFDAALITDNVINGEVGGVAISPVTYATSNAATLTAIASAIESAGSNVSAVSDGTDTITVTTAQDSADEDLTNFVVTGGASEAGTTITETASSVHTDNIGRIRNDDDSSTATVAPAGSVRVLEKASADYIVPVSINLN